MKKVIITILAILLLAAIGSFIFRGKIFENKKAAVSQKIADDNEASGELQEVVQETAQQDSEKLEEKIIPIPDSILLEVPFISQTPFTKWDALHEDACEEASLIMVKYFLDNKKTISKEQAEKEIQDMVKFEGKNKYGASITLGELNDLANKYYKLGNGRLEKNITVDDIKKELANGHPVIVGAAGKVLPNPNFKNGGPNYHMLVIKGYDKNGFITNDPGTRLGEGFKYTFDDMYKSIHDWNAKNILNGGKDYLLFN